MKTTISFQKLLWAFFAFIGGLILVRFIYTGKYAFIFLIWNLFLAWIPFTISTFFKMIANADKWKQVIVFSAWLIFFPNALYIVTDLIHLEQETSVPKWYDAVLLFSSSAIGVIMAFVSLLQVERYLAHKFNRTVVQVIVFSILFLGSFGVYLGRFLRWNSWDIISNPLGLLSSIGQRFVFPLQHIQTWGITIILTTAFYLLYLVIKKLPGYLNQAIQ
ncbi:DUF1361 domain-containing protein [Ferruginibacter sp.]|nr:DUF1361 domain-containing protein [Ferruginibacter sp.]